MKSKIIFIALASIACFACREEKKMFSIHDGSSLGIEFQNTLTVSDTFNAMSFEYIYNGAGLGIGDFDNDGRQDIFFAGNQVPSELYLNKGKLSFSNVTKASGISTSRWITGVSVVDINADGWEDIYLCVAGRKGGEQRRNMLFINKGLQDGVPVFQESAKQFGLDNDGYSTMSAFFDYDLDGDLDMYLVNNWLEKFNRNNVRPKQVDGNALSNDHLYRNNGDNTFSDVTREAGILIEGYGLGIGISDFNQDGYPDVYVANDFITNDLIWVNNGDGTFTNKAGTYLKHQTHNGMGVDIADFNNDGLVDIVEVDMLPASYKRQKLMTSGQNYESFHMSLRLGYQPQYMRNTLQLNRGKNENGDPVFSEIAFHAGVAKTDWSWAPLFVDFDRDGNKDLFIGNGYRKDITNLDYVFFGESNNPFGTAEARGKRNLKELETLPEVKESNYVFRNNGTLTFDDVTKEWGLYRPNFSNGVGYADFDGDGDIDIVTNNIDEEVTFYENRATELHADRHSITLLPESASSFNQKIWLYAGGKMQYQEITPYRGFQSTVMAGAFFGLGTSAIVDSIVVEWPDRTRAAYEKIKADTILKISKGTSTRKSSNPTQGLDAVRFDRMPSPSYRHVEKSGSDIKVTRTLIHELAQSGPCMAVGDVNGDKLDDFFIGAESSPSLLFVQKQDGTFSQSVLNSDATREDGAALFFDADGDGDKDLFVGGSCVNGFTIPSASELYVNDGTGKLTKSSSLPELLTTCSAIAAGDYDNDGDLDLFVGGRMEPKKYPDAARSFVLQNENGKFSDVTAKVNASLQRAGLVSSAVWCDIDNDKDADLILAGEWMPISVFRNDNAVLTDVTKQWGLDKTNGWWNCLAVGDFNEDGYADVIAGNAGTNLFLQADLKHPVVMIAKDFDQNGSMDPLMLYYSAVENEQFILHNRLVLIDQIPGFKRRFPTFTLYATTPVEKALSDQDLVNAKRYEAYELSSVMLTSVAGKKFSISKLPEVHQLSSIKSIAVDDVNADGHLDLLMVGNDYGQETMMGYYDASIGEVALNDGQGNFKPLTASADRFVADKDARFIHLLRSSHGREVLIGNNNDSLQLYKEIPPTKHR